MWSRIPIRVIFPPAFLLMAAAIAGAQFASPLGASAARPGKAPSAAPQAQPGAADPRRMIAAAIRAALDSFVKAFESRQPRAVAAAWTEDGELQPLEGPKAKGRDEIGKHFAAVFIRAQKQRPSCTRTPCLPLGEHGRRGGNGKGPAQLR